MSHFLSEFLSKPNFWNIAAAGVAFVSLVWAATKLLAGRWREARSDYSIALLNRSDAEEIARIVAPRSVAENCKAGLISLDGALQRLCGRPWSWRLFNTSLLWAFVGPIIVFAFAWLAGADGSFGGLQAFPDLPNLSDRTTRLGGTIAFTCGLLLFGSKFESILRALTRMTGDVSGAVGRASTPQFATRRSNPLVQRSAGPLSMIGTALVAVIFALSFAVGVAVAIYLATTMGLTTAFILGFAVALAFAFGQAFAGAFCAAGLGALYYALVSKASVMGVQPGIMIAFFLAIPLGFSLSLFLTWSGTQGVVAWLVRQDAGSRAGLTLQLLGVCACMVIASLGALLLAALTGLTLTAANALLSARELPALDWHGYFANVLVLGPAQPDAWLPVGMIASVLTPVGLIVAFGGAAILLAASPDRRKADALFRANERLSPEQRGSAALCLARLDILRAPLRFVLCVLAFWGLMALVQAANPDDLVRVARLSGDMLDH